MDLCSNCENSLAHFKLCVSNKFGSASEATDAHALEDMKSIQVRN